MTWQKQLSHYLYFFSFLIWTYYTRKEVFTITILQGKITPPIAILKSMSILPTSLAVPRRSIIGLKSFRSLIMLLICVFRIARSQLQDCYQGRAERKQSDPEWSGITLEWKGVDNKSRGTTLASAHALCLDLLSRVWLHISGGRNCCQECRRGMVQIDRSGDRTRRRCK